MVNLVEKRRETHQFSKIGGGVLLSNDEKCQKGQMQSPFEQFETFTLFACLLTGFSRNEH